MEIKEQVLNVNQVRELQELGFDVNKHSSLKSNGEQIIIKDDFLYRWCSFISNDDYWRYN